MNIDKAIELLDLHSNPTIQTNTPNLWSALQLGIRALDRLRYARLHPSYDYHRQLPGEN